jgi:hypothetical protein
MHTSKLPMPAANLPIARIRTVHDLFALVPREIHQLLLVIDPVDEAESALNIALEITERWGSQITLVHAGRLSGWRSTPQLSVEKAWIDLLCLSWQLKGAHGEISISKSLPSCLADVLDEATERKADLVLLPEPLAARFRHPELTMFSGSGGVSPCPIVIVMEPESDWYGV